MEVVSSRSHLSDDLKGILDFLISQSSRDISRLLNFSYKSHFSEDFDPKVATRYVIGAIQHQYSDSVVKCYREVRVVKEGVFLALNGRTKGNLTRTERERINPRLTDERKKKARVKRGRAEHIQRSLFY